MPLRRFHSLLAAVGLLAASWLPAAIVTAVPAHAAGFNNATAEAALVDAINADRATNGRGPLLVNPILSNIARGAPYSGCGGITISGRSQDMIERGYFSHQIPPCGSYVWPVLSAYGQRYTTAGENIGWTDFAPGQSVAQINSSFMNSPEHRSNILGPFNQVGVGAFLAPGQWQGHTGVIMFTEIFISGPAPAIALPEFHPPGPVAAATPGRAVPTNSPPPATAATPTLPAAPSVAVPTPPSTGRPLYVGTGIGHDVWVHSSLVGWQLRNVGHFYPGDGRATGARCASWPEVWTILASLIGAARISPGPCLDCRGSPAAVYQTCQGTGSRAGAGLAGSVR